MLLSLNFFQSCPIPLLTDSFSKCLFLFFLDILKELAAVMTHDSRILIIVRTSVARCEGVDELTPRLHVSSLKSRIA